MTINSDKTLYAVGSQSHVTFMDPRTMKNINYVGSKQRGTGKRLYIIVRPKHFTGLWPIAHIVYERCGMQLNRDWKGRISSVINKACYQFIIATFSINSIGSLLCRISSVKSRHKIKLDVVHVWHWQLAYCSSVLLYSICQSFLSLSVTLNVSNFRY